MGISCISLRPVENQSCSRSSLLGQGRSGIDNKMCEQHHLLMLNFKSSLRGTQLAFMAEQNKSLSILTWKAAYLNHTLNLTIWYVYTITHLLGSLYTAMRYQTTNAPWHNS